jgi:hypothetical protein
MLPVLVRPSEIATRVVGNEWDGAKLTATVIAIIVRLRELRATRAVPIRNNREGAFEHEGDGPARCTRSIPCNSIYDILER